MDRRAPNCVDGLVPQLWFDKYFDSHARYEFIFAVYAADDIGHSGLRLRMYRIESKKFDEIDMGERRTNVVYFEGACDELDFEHCLHLNWCWSGVQFGKGA